MHRNRAKAQAGTALVEASLALLLFTTMIFTLCDVGYVMYFHQTLVDRARAAARYGALNPTDTTGMQNVALYYQPTGSGSGVFGLQTPTSRPHVPGPGRLRTASRLLSRAIASSHCSRQVPETASRSLSQYQWKQTEAGPDSRGRHFESPHFLIYQQCLVVLFN